MNDKFVNTQEKLFRAVWPETKRMEFWKSDGTLSSAALKDKNGLSVNRTGEDRTEKEALKDFRKRLEGKIVSFKVQDCNDMEILIQMDMPRNPNNPYHCELHGSCDKKILSSKQAKLLAKRALIENSEEL